MFAPNFDEALFRKNLQPLRLTPRDEQQLVTRLKWLIANDEQFFPAGFYRVGETVEEIARQKSIDAKTALTQMLADPSPLFIHHDIPVANTQEAPKTKSNPDALPAYMRILDQRRTPRDRTKLLSANTIESLSIPPNDKMTAQERAQRRLRAQMGALGPVGEMPYKSHFRDAHDQSFADDAPPHNRTARNARTVMSKPTRHEPANSNLHRVHALITPENAPKRKRTLRQTPEARNGMDHSETGTETKDSVRNGRGKRVDLPSDPTLFKSMHAFINKMKAPPSSPAHGRDFLPAHVQINWNTINKRLLKERGITTAQFYLEMAEKTSPEDAAMNTEDVTRNVTLITRKLTKHIALSDIALSAEMTLEAEGKRPAQNGKLIEYGPLADGKLKWLNINIAFNQGAYGLVDTGFTSLPDFLNFCGIPKKDDGSPRPLTPPDISPI